MLRKWQWLFTWVLGVAMVASLYLDFIYSPPEAQMGNVVRIMYFHIASALDAFTAFGITALAGFIFLLVRSKAGKKMGLFGVPELWDRVAAASAEIGLLFTTLVLISGSLWGAAVWNTWWTWDPTLTTTLILWFLYVGYLLLRASILDHGRAAVVSAIYGIIAAVDVPIIHESVTWWKGLHPTVITDAGFNMPPSMVVTLLFSFAVFMGVYALFLWMVIRLDTDRAEVAKLREMVRIKVLQSERRG